MCQSVQHAKDDSIAGTGNRNVRLGVGKKDVIVARVPGKVSPKGRQHAVLSSPLRSEALVCSSVDTGQCE